MPIKKGTTNVGPIYLGTTEIIRKYLGTHIFYNSQPDIPADYAPLEWIESTGTQYISTGYNKLGTFVLDCAFTSSTGRTLLGFSTNAGNYFEKDANNKLAMGGNNVVNVDITTRKIITFTRTSDTATVSCDGLSTSRTPQEPSVSNYPFKFMGAGISNVTTYDGGMKCWGLKIYDTDNKLVRDFVPVYRVADGVVGFYEKKNGVFYTNAGTGEFIAPFLPYAYQKVKYIGATGTQFINTLYKANLNTRVEVKYRYTTLPVTTAIVFGAHGSESSPGTTSVNSCLFGCASSGKLYARFDNVTSATSNVEKDTNWHVAEVKKAGATLDGETLVTFPGAGTFEGTNPLHLFCSVDGEGIAQYKIIGEIEYAKIWENDVLKRSFIPCFRKSDDVIGLYDEVNGVFYTNAGTGVFTRGGIVVDNFQEVEYVQCEPTGATGDGNGPYINTGIIPNDEMGYSVTLAVTYSSSDKTRFGCRNDDDDTRFWCGFASGKLYWGYNVVMPTNSAERPSISTGTFYNVKANYLNDKKITLDGTEYHTSGTSYDLPTLNKSGEWTQPFVIFGSNNKGTITSRESKVKEVKITRGLVVSYYFLPVYRKSDNEVGLLDIMNNVFYTNAATGSLVKGNDI